MTEKEREFLLDLLGTPSPSGFEHEGQEKWRNYVGEAADAVESDSYGSAWAVLHPDPPGKTGRSIMLEAHCDEIGLMVSHISDKGFLHVTRIGGSDRATARGKRVRLLGANGEVRGVVGNTAIHLRDRNKEEKTPEWHQLFIDIGACSRKEVEQRGIHVGTPAVFADEPELLDDHHLVGRALDNRIGGFIIAESLKELATRNRPNATVYAVNSVQEEIGLKGAQMVAYRLKPSIALVLDVTHATDSPGIDKEKFGAVTMGGGPTITHGTSNHRQLVQRVVKVAEAEEIPLQHEASSTFTGTDSDSIYVTAGGIPSALVSLPMRYMHSTVEMVDLRDVAHCIRLLAAVARSLGADATDIVQHAG